MPSQRDMTLRKSARLNLSGYYDSEGKPYISYRETLCRVNKRRRSRSRSKSGERSRDRNSISNDTDSDQNHGRNSNRTRTDTNRQRNHGTDRTINDSDRTRNRLYSALFNQRTFGLFFLIIRLCSGLACLTPTFEIFTALCSGRCQIYLRQLMTPEGDRLPNFALESLGAGIIYEKSSQSYCTQEARLWFFRMPIGQPPLSPKTVLQGQSPLIPGVCWPFAGDRGHLTISLLNQVTISHVTLGHIPKHLSPTATIPSAPKDFSVYGLESLDDQGTLLGTFVYDQDGNSIQTFKLSDLDKGAFRFVRVQVESNWGHPDFTCLYNFRIHGELAA